MGKDKDGVYTKSTPFFNDMRITAFICDLLKGIVVEITLLVMGNDTPGNSQRLIEFIALIVSFVLLIFITLAQLIYESCCVCEKDNHGCDCKTCQTNQGFCLNLASSLMLIATWSYFVGDNLTNFYNYESQNKDFRRASQALLLIGLTGYRFIPKFQEFVYKCNGIKIKEEDEDEWLDVKKVKKLVKETAVLVPEIDAWFTIITNITVTCSTGGRALSWTVYGLTIVALLVYIVAQAASLKADTSKLKMVGLVFSAVVLGVGLVASFLLGNNAQPFDCTITCIPMTDIDRVNVTCTSNLESPISPYDTFKEIFNENSTVVLGPDCYDNSKARVISLGISAICFIIPVIYIVCIRMHGWCNKSEKKNKNKNANNNNNPIIITIQ